MLRDMESWSVNAGREDEIYGWCHQCKQHIAQFRRSHLCPMCDETKSYACPWTERRREERREEESSVSTGRD